MQYTLYNFNSFTKILVKLCKFNKIELQHIDLLYLMSFHKFTKLSVISWLYHKLHYQNQSFSL